MPEHITSVGVIKECLTWWAYVYAGDDYHQSRQWADADVDADAARGR